MEITKLNVLTGNEIKVHILNMTYLGISGSLGF